MRHAIAFVLVTLLLAPKLAGAQPATARSHHVPTWIAVGAGSGFGIGLWAGLTAFDDSINSDRKVWTTAIVSAAAGGLLAYVLARNTHEKRHDSTATAGAKDAPATLGAMRCDRCDAGLWHQSHVAPDAPVTLVAPDAPVTIGVYSLRSPSTGETRDALAAGR